MLSKQGCSLQNCSTKSTGKPRLCCIQNCSIQWHFELSVTVYSLLFSVVSPYSFSIGDTSEMEPYLHGGIAVQVKTPKLCYFVSVCLTELGSGVLMLRALGAEFSTYNFPRTIECPMFGRDPQGSWTPAPGSVQDSPRNHTHLKMSLVSRMWNISLTIFDRTCSR